MNHTHWTTRLGGLLLLLGLLMASTGCATRSYSGFTRYARKADAPRPPSEKATVDFSRLSDQKVSHSFYSRGLDRNMMARIALSPNLVLPSSRSSVAEAMAWGPVTKQQMGDQTVDYPQGEYAVGDPVDIKLSALLMKYLASKGSILVAPAVSRRFNVQAWCGDNGGEGCADATWVERLLLMRTQKQQTDMEAATDDLPTAMLSVESLLAGAGSEEFYLLRRGSGRYEARFKWDVSSEDEKNIECKGRISVPVYRFRGEFVSIVDGRILARINEQVFPRLSGNMVHEVDAVVWEARRRSAYTERDEDGRGVADSKYSYVASWEQRGTLCEGADKALTEIRDQAADLGLSRVVPDLLDPALRPFYGQR